MTHGTETGLRFALDASGVSWKETGSAGVRWKLIASDGRGEGALAGGTVLISMAPGRGYPPHRHLGIEEVLVLAGGYRDSRGTHRAGDYVRYESGSEHAPVALGDPARPSGPDNPDCILYATARGGIEPLSLEQSSPRPEKRSSEPK